MESTETLRALGKHFWAKEKVEGLDTSIGVIHELDKKVENATQAFTEVGEKLKQSFSICD